jgi:integrase
MHQQRFLILCRKGITLYEEMDPTVRWRCPFRKFLALALADNVFTHQRTPEDFDDRWISPTAASRTFQIKEDKKCLPLLRKIQGHRISSSKILSAMSMNAVLKELCEDAGYTERVTCYSFRRGFANKAEGDWLFLH